MKWASALGTGKTVGSCVRSAVEQIVSQLGPEPLDVAIAFVSSSFRDHYDKVPDRVQGALPVRTFIGCSGGGVIGNAREVEFEPAVSLTAARLPDVTIKPFHVTDERIPDLDDGPSAWEEVTGVPASRSPHFILLADAFSFEVENFVMGLDFAYPRATKIGGLASDAREAQGNALFLNDRCHRSGLVGLAVSGQIAVESLVAQGCRPIGKPMMITRCHKNVIIELDQRRPVDVLQDLVENLSPRDLELIRHSLFMGVVMDPLKNEFGHGDFLIRGVLGLDTDQGIMAVATMVRKGQMVQFHLRDARTSTEDLEAILRGYSGRSRPAGALLFSCLGRGKHLYGQADHDSSMFVERIGSVPLGGFFCNGEIGPVGGTTHLHGYTSCFGLFREPAASK